MSPLRKMFPLMTMMCIVVLATSCATARAQSPGDQITVLYDAFGRDASMTKDWGFSALVEVAGKRILFDTGNDSEILARNVAAKGVDLTRLDFVVMSHRHGDHMGGLNYLLEVNPDAVWAACSPDFGTPSVLDRFAQLEPKVLLCVDGYRYGGRPYSKRKDLKNLVSKLPSLEHVVLIRKLEPDNPDSPVDAAVLWDELFDSRPVPEGELQFEQVPFDHPL